MLKQIPGFVLSGLLLLATIGPLEAAPTPKDTPFGVTFTTANFQNGVTLQDKMDAFSDIVQVGSTVMLVYLWGNSSPEELDNLRTQVALARQHGLKVFIQFASVGRGLPTPPDELPKTWGSAETRDRYLNDVMVVAGMRPDYLNLSPEVNIMAFFEPEEFDIFKGIYISLYDLVKSVTPDTQVGLSYLDVLWVGRDQSSLPDELGPRDYIGVTTYPDAIFDTPEDVPAGWYTQFRSAYSFEPIIFTEVGWGSSEPSTRAEQAAFVTALPALFRNVEPQLIIWALLHESGFFQVRSLDQEALDFLDSVNVDPDELFAKFNSVGLLNADGSVKPAWFEALLLDFSGEE